MATDVLPSHLQHFRSRERSAAYPWTRWAVPVGRVFFSLMFILSGLGHFSSGTIQYAASQGVPAASFLVPASGVLAVVGGVLVALGLWTRLGALLIVVFLVPVTFMMHGFWDIADPQLRQVQYLNFMKNLSMLGGALILTWMGGGPVSVDERRASRPPEAQATA
jgi:putative oxidoreductase